MPMNLTLALTVAALPAFFALAVKLGRPVTKARTKIVDLVV